MLHGGEIYGPIDVRHDFSVNINPLGIPEQVYRRLEENRGALMQYPDRKCAALRRALSVFTGVPEEQILCGNGASELIEASIRTIRPQKVLVTAPSFSGYARAVKNSGAELVYHELKREDGFALTARFLQDLEKLGDSVRLNLVILCSPSNPVGNRIAPELLTEIAERCARLGIWLMVDECFLCFTENETEWTMRRYLTGTGFGIADRLLVLDAFTKRFAMPGVRLGYLMAKDPPFLSKVAAQQPEWSVSATAQTAGTAALENADEYLRTARRMIASERLKMETALCQMGCTVFPGEANYIFFSSEKPLFELLLEKGILIRDCSNYPGLKKGDYRVAVKTPGENRILIKAVEEIMG